jgi:hydrogenase maturation protease
MVHTRVLCLGNELLADDGFAFSVADWLRQRSLEGVEVACTSQTGFQLLDHVMNVSRLLVIDTVQTGSAAPGTIYQLHESDFAGMHGVSPHSIGLFETLALGRKLGLPVAREVTIFAVEAADCSTVGGAMNPALKASVPVVEKLIGKSVQRLAHFQSQNEEFIGPASAIR